MQAEQRLFETLSLATSASSDETEDGMDHTEDSPAVTSRDLLSHPLLLQIVVQSQVPVHVGSGILQDQNGVLLPAARQQMLNMCTTLGSSEHAHARADTALEHVLWASSEHVLLHGNASEVSTCPCVL